MISSHEVKENVNGLREEIKLGESASVFEAP
jgi:hypothetical protein